MRFRYKGCSIHVHTIRGNSNQWYFTVTITSPKDKPIVEEWQVLGEADSEAAVADVAKKQAVASIDSHYP